MNNKKKIIIISAVILAVIVAVIILVFTLRGNENKLIAIREVVENGVTTTTRAEAIFTDEDILELTRETITYEFTDEEGAINLYNSMPGMLEEGQEISRRGRTVTIRRERIPIREATREEVIEFYESSGFEIR